MNEDGLKRQMLNTFKPDPRDSDLVERLEQYYRETSADVSNKIAMIRWKCFKQWADERGYTSEEINRAKMIAARTKEEL